MKMTDAHKVAMMGEMTEAITTKLHANQISFRDPGSVRQGSATEVEIINFIVFELSRVAVKHFERHTSEINACCTDENRNLNGGCDSCGDPCL